jgi:hypothetical protein
MSAKFGRELIGGWTNRKCEEYWYSINGQKQAKSFLKRPSAKRAGELLDLRRNQLQTMMGQLTALSFERASKQTGAGKQS